MFQREQLQEQQQEHFSELHKQAREQEVKLEGYEAANKKQVAQAVQLNLELEHMQEKELEGTHTLGLILPDINGFIC